MLKPTIEKIILALLGLLALAASSRNIFTGLEIDGKLRLSCRLPLCAVTGTLYFDVGPAS